MLQEFNTTITKTYSFCKFFCILCSNAILNVFTKELEEHS